MAGHVISGAGFSPVETLPGESVLAAFLRRGVSIPFSCRGGTCQTCVRRCLRGTIPARAQRGLDAALADKGYFMPCVCEPESDMEIAPPVESDFVTECLVDSLSSDGDALRLQLEPMRTVTARLGQRFRVGIGGAWDWVGEVVTVPQDDYYLGLALAGVDPAADGSWRGVVPGATLQVRPESQAGDPAASGSEAPGALPGPDLALWASLDDGRKVRAVLDDFYSRVYKDERLAPYFVGVTQHHVAGKQYSFLCKAMTGEPVYFGDAPRNAHHWMVISDELFDHRQALMRQTQRDHGLTEDQIARWERYELPHRSDIVKPAAIPKVLFGREMPLEGWGEETLLVGAVCDGCGTVLSPGDRVRFHLRLGTLSCANCTGLLT